MANDREGKDEREPFPSNVELRRRLSTFGASQLIWDELERTAARVALLRSRTGLSAEQQAILDQCEQKLGIARKHLDRVPRRSYAFWGVIHQIDALLVQVEPVERLGPIALGVLAKLPGIVRDRRLHEAWLGEDEKSGPLPLLVQRLVPCKDEKEPSLEPASLSPEEEASLRSLLQGALRLMHEQRDKSFWQLGTNVSIYQLSAALLIALCAGALLAFRSASSEADYFGVVALLGAAGAVIANMLVKEPFIASIGPTSRYFAHNLFAKPVTGAFAALAFILVERSGLLFEIVANGEESSAPVRIVVGSNPVARQAALALVALAAGFFAEKALHPLMDQVLRKLYSQSERYMAAETSDKDSDDRGPPAGGGSHRAG